MKRAVTKTEKKEPKLAVVKAQLAESIATVSWLEYCLEQNNLNVKELVAEISQLRDDKVRLADEKAELLRESWWACTVRKVNECWVQFVK